MPYATLERCLQTFCIKVLCLYFMPKLYCFLWLNIIWMRLNNWRTFLKALKHFANLPAEIFYQCISMEAMRNQLLIITFNCSSLTDEKSNISVWIHLLNLMLTFYWFIQQIFTDCLLWPSYHTGAQDTIGDKTRIISAPWKLRIARKRKKENGPQMAL